MSIYLCSCSLFASNSCSWWTWPFSCLTECFNNSFSFVKAPTFICSRCNWETCNNTFVEINHVDKYGSGILRFATGWFKSIRIKLKPIVTRDLLALDENHVIWLTWLVHSWFYFTAWWLAEKSQGPCVNQRARSLRWCYTGRFATTILAQHSAVKLGECCNHWKQCRNNVATLCCAKNCRCESSSVTSP